MATNINDDSDLSFIEKKDANALSGKDLYYTVLRNLHWFILFALIGAAIAWYRSDKMNRIYESHAKIIVTSVTRNRLDNGQSMLENITNRRVATTMNAINDEIIVIKSESAMLEVANRLNLGMTYQYQTRLVKRVKDLYKESPVEVNFLDISPNDYASMVITIDKDSTFVISSGEYEPVHGRLRDTVTTTYGRVAVQPTWALRELFYDNPITVTHSSISGVAENYRHRVSVTRNSTSDGIINFSLHDTSPERAADILNEMISVYNETTIEDKMNIIRLTSDYINSRIAQLDADLGVQESQIASFKRDNQLLSLNNYGQSYLNKSIQSSEEVDRLLAQISHAQYLQGLIASNTENKLFPITIDIDDDNIKGTISRFNELVLRLDRYKSTGTTNNPVVQDMLVEQSTLKSNLDKLLTTYIGAIQQKVATVEAVGQEASDQIRQVPGRQQYIDNILRVQGIKEQLYLTLLGKREELLISQPSIEGNAKIIDKARVNRSPIAPNTKRNILMGILLGLCVPVVVFIIQRILDTKVRFRKDVENYTNLPVLGEIPAKKKGDGRHIVIADKKRDQISEAFRILRSNIEFTRNTDKSCTSYLFVSLMENSGKTFLTANLAASLAMVEKRVILLDLDLRKGTQTKNYTKDKLHGFSTYLSGKTDDFESIIQHDLVAPGVDLIPSGSIPPNPAELLSSSRLDRLMEWLREHYDFILMDAVPAGIVADADILKRFADVTVFVIRSRMVDKRMLPDLQELKDRKIFPNMTVILNDVKYKKRRGYGKYGGYGSYKDDDEDDGKKKHHRHHKHHKEIESEKTEA